MKGYIEALSIQIGVIQGGALGFCRCLQNGGKSESPVNTDSGFVANGKAPKKGKGGKPKLVVPPKLLMAIEKDRALKDRLKRYNLPIKGSRQVPKYLPDASLRFQGPHLLEHVNQMLITALQCCIRRFQLDV